MAVRLNYMAAMLADFIPGGKVIDIGCGTGEMLEVLREHQLQAFGLDFSFKMLEAIANSSLDHSFPLINGEIETLPFQTHIPRHFNKKAQEAGLMLVEHNFFHFSPVPWPLNRLVPRFYVRIGLKMEKLSRSKLGFLGRRYISKYQKL